MPLDNANVFLTNTTFGTKTDSKGYYILTSIPKGSFELVVSYIGYQTHSVKISSYKDTTIQLNVSLEPALINLEEVKINAPLPEEWKVNFEIFRKEFLGVTENSELTKIINPEVIDFVVDDERQNLTASSDSTIIVENNALGYRLYITTVRL